MAAIAWDLLAAGWVSRGGDALTVVSFTSVTAAIVIARLRVSRIVSLLAFPVVALATIVPITTAEMPTAPGQSVGTFVVRYVAAAVTGLTSTQTWSFTVGLCGALFACGYWLAWFTVREHHGVLAVVPVFTVLAINVINAAAPELLVLPEGIAIGLALGVIAAAHRKSLRAGWVAGRITPLGRFGWRFGASASLVATGLTVTALILPPASTTALSGWLLAIGRGGGQAGSINASGTETIGFASAVSLGGPLVSEPKPVLTYSTDTQTSAYLSVVTDTDFDRGNWYPSASASIAGGYTWTGLQYAGDQLPRDPDPVDGGIGSDEQTVRARIVLTPTDTGRQQYALFTGEPEAINLPGIAFGVVSAASPDELLTVNSVQFTADAGSQASTLQTTSLISTATAAQLSAAGTSYPQWTQQYTELNDELDSGR